MASSELIANLSENSDTWRAAELICPISLSSQFRKPKVKFIVDRVEPVHTTGENAFDRLMASARRLQREEQQSAQPQLPAPHDTSSTRFTQKDAMYNHVLDNLLAKNNLLFENKQVALMVRVVTDVLWNIDEHHDKINHQSTFSSQVSSMHS